MPDLSALQERQQSLIRKALNGSAWLGPDDTVAPATLTTGPTADPTPLPDGFVDAGHITKDDGLAFSRDIDTSDTMSWGVFEPTRRDINQDIDTVKWTMQETKRLSLELYWGVDLSAVTPTAVTGEVAFNKISSPATTYRRFMAITQDGAGADAVYLGRFHPRLAITAFEDQSWTDGTEIQYGVTGTAYVDPVLGYSTRLFFGGPGWRAMLDAMGFPAIAP
jgi:hypothetical protein